MAVTADRVIVELEAKLDRYEANVRRAEQKFDSATRAIAADAKRMERQIAASSGAVGAQFRQLAATFGAAFSAQQVAALADNYTLFTNQLKVAGLEGSNLADVQERLFTIAQKSGTPLELLGRLYGGLASLQKDLGATSADSIALSQAVSNSIGVQGTSAEQAAGGILGLNQALGQTRVQTDEYNQILDGLRPLLQAAVDSSDKYAGSLGRLKNAIGEGEVSGRDLFLLLQGGFDQLAEKADRVNLTIAQSFTILSNALTKYIGEADQANGASATVSAALIAISENLDTVTNALGVLAAVMLGRFVAGMVAGAASTGVASTAIFALQARAVGAATTMEALALTSATAGRAMLAAFGGPVGIAVTALAVGIGYLATRTEQATQATEVFATAQREAGNVSKQAADAADALATATGRAREQALANAKTLREEIKQKLASAQASLILAAAEAQRANAFARRTRASGGLAAADPRVAQAGGRRLADAAAARAARADANERAAFGSVQQLEGALQRINAAIGSVPGVANVAAPSSAGRGSSRSTRAKTGPDPDDIARRFADDLAAAEIDLKNAFAEATGTAQARRDFERAQIAAEQERAARQIKADDDYTAAQKERLLALNDQIAAQRLATLKIEEQAEAAAQAIDVQLAGIADQQELLRLQSGLADTARERRDLELRILELQREEERIRLQGIEASTTATEAEKEIARRRLAQLDQEFNLRAAGVARQNESPLERYRREMNRTPAQTQELAEQWIVDELEGIQNTLSSAIQKKLGVKDPVLGSLIDLFIQNVILKPLTDVFSQLAGGGAGGGGGGLLGALIGIGTSIAGAFGGGAFGGGASGGGLGTPSVPNQSPWVINNFRGPRASGGHVLGGELYRVNETGIEGFRPPQSGQIIPLGRMRGAGGGGAPRIYQTIKIDASNSVTPDGFADYIVERTRKETSEIVSFAAKRTNQNVPNRMAQYQRDGT